MIHREYQIEPSRWAAVSGKVGFDALARGLGPALTLSVKVSSLPLLPGEFLLNWAGAATCRFSLTGRWFRDAAVGIGRDNRAAHRVRTVFRGLN